MKWTENWCNLSKYTFQCFFISIHANQSYKKEHKQYNKSVRFRKVQKRFVLRFRKNKRTQISLTYLIEILQVFFRWFLYITLFAIRVSFLFTHKQFWFFPKTSNVNFLFFSILYSCLLFCHTYAGLTFVILYFDEKNLLV